jgi:hypothetical protein
MPENTQTTLRIAVAQSTVHQTRQAPPCCARAARRSAG